MKAKMAAGNWKMNGLGADHGEIEVLISDMDDSDCDVLICPPATLIRPMRGMALGSVLQVGAQDCNQEFSIHALEQTLRLPVGSASARRIIV